MRARFEAARGNVMALEQLNADLRGLTSEGAVDLQCDVMIALKALRSGRQAPLPPAPLPQATSSAGPMPDRTAGGASVLQGIFTDNEMPGPDGRPLYRYQVSDSRFGELFQSLEHLHSRGLLEQPSERSAAVFVLYVAEWFRREYDGEGYRWESPAPQIIGSLSDGARKALAQKGLAWWGRKPRRTDHGEMRLLSLSLEGGFPTRLLESRDQAWIAVHLRTVVLRVEALTAPSEDDAAEISRTAGGSLRSSYDNEDFHALCADLALAVVGLKREARLVAPQGVSASAWLDGTRPTWRDDLPIRITGEGARRLLDDLVSARIERLGSGEAGCRRLLLREGEDWAPGIRLVMDGEVRLRTVDLSPSDGRLRVHAAGALASVLAAELGLLEPPTEDGDGWLCRPRGAARNVAVFPFESAVEVELRGGDRSIGSVTWPRGEALRSEVMVFVDDRGDTVATPPTELVYVGSGSLRTRRKRAYILAPSKFAVTPTGGGEALLPIWKGARSLFEIDQPVYAGVSDGDRYRIDVGADVDRADQLVLEGALLQGAVAIASGLPLYAGAPSLRVRSGGRAESPKVGQLRWRHANSPVWKDWATAPPLIGCGEIEVIWRDPHSGTLRDRQRFAVLTRDARVRGRSIAGGPVRFTLEGMAGWNLVAPPSELTSSQTTPEGLVVSFKGRPSRRVDLILQGPRSSEIGVTARAALGSGGFARADGTLFPPHSRIMVEDLRGATAFVDGRERLYLRGPEGGSRIVHFVEEIALWSLSEEISRLLSASSELDDTVSIELGGMNGSKLVVGRYAASLLTDGKTVTTVMDSALDDVAAVHRLEWFSICHPGTRLISERNWTERSSRRAEALPEDLAGPGLVLLRQGDRLIGRPTLVVGEGEVCVDDTGELQRAALVADTKTRLASIKAALEGLGAETSDARCDREYLLRLLSALDGVPPAAFDVFKALSASPEAQAQLFSAASDDAARALVWELERDLPVLWALIPVPVWARAFDRRSGELKALLVGANIPEAQAAGMARDAIARAAEALSALDPILRTPLSLNGLCEAPTTPPPPLVESAQDRIRRTAEPDGAPRRREVATGFDPAAVSRFRRPESPFRDQLPDLSRFDGSQWEGLDAAFVAALAAAGMGRPGQGAILRIRSARAVEPLSFADLYAEALRLLARGQRLAL